VQKLDKALVVTIHGIDDPEEGIYIQPHKKEDEGGNEKRHPCSRH